MKAVKKLESNSLRSKPNQKLSFEVNWLPYIIFIAPIMAKNTKIKIMVNETAKIIFFRLIESIINCLILIILIE